jgi:lytic murein transglycosylase
LLAEFRPPCGDAAERRAMMADATKMKPGQRVASILFLTALLGWMVPASAQPPIAQPSALDSSQLDAATGSGGRADERAGRLDAEVRTLARDIALEAAAAGVSAAALERSFAGLSADASILDLLVRQPEHALAPWDYMARLASDSRIAEGRERLAEHAGTFASVEERFGVDRHVVAAIWGVESSYGALPGTRPVIASLATLTVADARRRRFWRKELLAALEISERGDMPAHEMLGSWAGAMGHTQFMPSTYLAHAVDHDGDGRRDIWRSIPDALASTANYLRHSGWGSGVPWGLEVVLPDGFDPRLATPVEARGLSEWQALGLRLASGRDWPSELGTSALLLPTGVNGPAFLVTSNYRAVLEYNNAMAYALAVGHLSDRLAGRPALVAAWPTDDPPLDHDGRRELQERLAAVGLDVGPIDGILGESTRAAVRAWQLRNGNPADGWPATRLLQRLRAATATAE